MNTNVLIICGIILASIVIRLIWANKRAGSPPVRTAFPAARAPGAPLPGLSPRVQDIARDPARKISAIKAYRDETGAGLREAKDAVEAWLATGEAWLATGEAQHGGAASPLPPSTHGAVFTPELSQHVKGIARDPAGKIAAIKAYREETGAGLAQAKDAVEAWLATSEARRAAAPSPTPASASGATIAPALSQRVRDTARDPTRRIAAIKAYQEETGAGLAEAKNAIEAWLASQGLR